jgi:tetratricopeptide (TPR) repeat protein
MKRGRVLSFEEARRLKKTNPRSRWRSVADEFAGDVWPDLEPSFRIRAGQTIFTIGSCFARNIERHLVTLGCRVPMSELHLPAEEFHGEPNGAMNRFHPPAFRQCLEWTARVFNRDGKVGWEDCEAFAFVDEAGRVFDLDMGGAWPVTRERFLERRQHVYDIFGQVFTADCVMMTPGLIEAWRDRTTGLYVHEPPTHKSLVVDRSRWELEILSYEQCETDLLAAIDVIRARNPEAKVLVTTSPVPLTATFSGQDIRIANTYSKSVLRAACGAAAMQRPLVDYFPSYESATLSFPVKVWEADRVHISSSFIGKIVLRMLDHYLEGVEDAARQHQAAKTFLLEGAYDKAEAAARATLAAWPEHAEAGIILAEALMRQDFLAEAEAQLRVLVERHPDRSELRINLARVISRSSKQRAAEAIEHVEQALALPSASLSDFRAVGELVRQKASPEAAERLTRRAVALYPLHVEAYSHLIKVLLDQGRKEEAIALLQTAAGLRRAPAALSIQLAELLIEAGRADEASVVLRHVRALEPQNAAAAALQEQLRGAVPVASARS